MPALISGFEYDIFISYRQKDNGGEKWVTQFVEALRIELDATFKEKISIYFDENPHDGLLEMHDVGKSLEGKLRCLIFIPVLSRTYCDPESFAWKHEFCAFNKLSRLDDYGRDIKAANGNVSSRILPVRIHELDPGDKALVESELGNVLRAIDFIYKSAGVNRPLRSSEERPQDNLLKTNYRDQINKLANAIREIVTSMQQKGVLGNSLQSAPATKQVLTSPGLTKKILAALAVMVLVGAILFYFKYSSSVLNDPADSGIAVLPFRNNTGNKDLDPYGLGMASAIRSRLSQSKSFEMVSSLQATIPYKETQKSPREIGSELGVNYFLSGIYQKDGEKIMVDVELVDAENGRVVWTLPIENRLEDIFDIQEKIASQVLSKFTHETASPVIESSTSNLEAYTHYARGLGLRAKPQFIGEYKQTFLEAFDPARKEFEQAVRIDSSFVDAWASLVEVAALEYLNEPKLENRRKIEGYMEYINSHFNASSRYPYILGLYAYRVTHDYDQALHFLFKSLESDQENVEALHLISHVYKRKHEFPKAIQYMQKVLALDPNNFVYWVGLNETLLQMGDYSDALKVDLKAWDLGDTTYARADDIMWLAIKTRTFPNSIPPRIRVMLGNDFTMWTYAINRNWEMAKQIAKVNHNDWRLIDFHLNLRQDDSAAMVATRALTKDPNDYLLLAASGQKNKALSVLKNLADKAGRDDKFGRAILLWGEIHCLTTARDFPAATEKLLQLNREYPAFGDYGSFEDDPIFDRVKKDYPPFADAVRNLKRQPLPDLSAVIRF